MKPLTTVLLGAGASVGARIPATIGMTEAIVEEVGGGREAYDDTAQALHFAVGALIAYDTSRGASPYAGVDVERLFSAVQMLGDRNNLEVTAFVASWSNALTSIGSSGRMPPFFDRDFERALLSEFPSQIERVFKAGVEAVVRRDDGGAAFRRLESRMLDSLRRLLAVDPSAVDYLAPLANVDGSAISIATLNYDRSVEALAQRAGLAVDTGIEGWGGGFQWRWRDGTDIRLLKLHGSIDWRLSEDRTDGKLPEPRINLVVHDDGTGQYVRSRPGIVFGQRGKLQADGPFLAMLAEWDNFLATCDHLLVVGYSFRDPHINAGLVRWLNADDGREMTIIDPNFEIDPPRTPGRMPAQAQSFLELLRRYMVAYDTKPPQLRPRFRVLNTTAEEGLVHVLGRGPTLADSAVQPL